MILGATLILVALVGLIFKSRFLVRLAAGSLAITVLWKVGEIRGWLMDAKSVAIMYMVSSIFAYIVSLTIPSRRKEIRPR